MTDPVDIVVYADVSVPYLDPDVRAALDVLRGAGPSLDEFRDGSRLATAAVRGAVVGCARAVRAPRSAPGPATAALRALGPDRYDEWLAGGLELTEVVVGAGHRRAGLGAALHRAVLTPARGGRAWTQLPGTGPATPGQWLRRRGWACVSTDRDTGATVLLAPRHPAVHRPDVTAGPLSPLSR